MISANVIISGELFNHQFHHDRVFYCLDYIFFFMLSFVSPSLSEEIEALREILSSELDVTCSKRYVHFHIYFSHWLLSVFLLYLGMVMLYLCYILEWLWFRKGLSGMF